MTGIVRYGVLSTAPIAVNRHLPAAQEARNAAVVAVSSRDEGKARALAAEFGVERAYGSYQEVLEDTEVDAVINPLPNSMHCEWTVRAADAGKHVLCEKPMAVSVEEAQRMVDAVHANGVLLMEGFTHRFNPQLQYARRAVAEGEIGPVKLVRAELTHALQDWYNDSRARKELAGGALLDAGCYCVSALRFVLGAEPETAQALQRVHPGYGVDSTFAGLLRFPGDCLAFMSTGMEQTFRCVCEVVGLDGRIEIGNMFDEQQAVKVVKNGEERVEAFLAPNRFVVQLEHFSSCLLEGRAPDFSPEDGLLNTKVLVALQRAAVAGKSVAV